MVFLSTHWTFPANPDFNTLCSFNKPYVIFSIEYQYFYAENSLNSNLKMYILQKRESKREKEIYIKTMIKIDFNAALYTIFKTIGTYYTEMVSE